MQSVSGNTTPVPLVSLRGVSKEFPGVKALDRVSIDLYAGEVHMIMGENGAGKSTLMKILCGAYNADEGEFLYMGRQETIASPEDAKRHGIAVIFQELSLVPHLDVAHNIFLGREPLGILPWQVDTTKLYQEAQKYLDILESKIDVRTPVYKLRVADQQMVEIAKALSQDARVLVLDEPTSALSDRETEQLFKVIRTLQTEGVAMAYISHRMAEVFELGDRITVIRDGKHIKTSLPSETSSDELVRLMVGRSVDMTYPREFCESPGELLLELKEVAAENGVSGINIKVRRGEIVGLSGLVGSGRTEVVRAIFGADRVTSGEVVYRGTVLKGSCVEASRSGIGLIPENRKTQGVALMRSVRENLLASSLARVFPSKLFKPAVATLVAQELIKRLRIATSSPEKIIGSLSGGNQQKVVIGKWLSADAELLIFDEPTRGIDVGAKSEIFKLIDAMVKSGKAVLMVSSELPEITQVCDRAYVMKEKRIVGELERRDLTPEKVMRLAVHHE